MIEISPADTALSKAFRALLSNPGILPAIMHANMTRSFGNYGRRLIKLQEELGEHAEGYLNVTSLGNGKGKSWDDVREEAADLLIVAADVAMTPLEEKDAPASKLVKALDTYTFDQLSQFRRPLYPTFENYEALTLKMGVVIGALSQKFSGDTGFHGDYGRNAGLRAAAAEVVGCALMLCLTPLPDQADWTAAQLEAQLADTIAVKLAKWRNNRDTGTAATDAE